MQQIGPYRVVDEIARGGMGVVYRARDAQGRDVALKLLLAQRAANPNARRRFEQEARALAKLQHPHVVPILAAGDHAGTPWLALEYVAGETLGDRLRTGPLRIPEALQIARQLAQALAYVHSCGVLHRDLQPGNVLLRDDQALLTDFGLSRDEASSLSRVTATGVFLGTPGYWAPEQAQGAKHAFGPHTDVYGLGALLYACLTGQAPVEGASLQEYLRTARFRETPPPSSLRPDVPAWLSELCMRCLALDPAQRPASADEVARALLVGGAAAAPRRRSTAPLLLGLLTVAALALCVGLVLWSVSDDEAPPVNTTPVAEVDSEPVVPPPPAPPQPDTPATLLAEAQQAIANLQPREAIELAERALNLNPRSGEAHWVRGLAKAHLRQLDDALVDLDRAVEFDPELAGAYRDRGTVYQSMGRPQLALRDLTRAIELDPKVAGAYVDRGTTRADLNDLQGALHDYDAALELEPSLLGYVNRGRAYQLLGRREDALADYLRAEALGPRDPTVQLNAGATLIQLKRVEEGIEHLDRALEYGHRNLERVYGLRGLAQQSLGRHAQAIADFDLALSQDRLPTNAANLRQARAQSQAALGR